MTRFKYDYMRKELEEEWKDIQDYEGFYQISNYGNVKSLERTVKGRWGYRKEFEKILKPCLCSGYQRVMLSKNSKMKGMLIHRLIAIHFIDNPYNLKIINHIDGNPLNNDINNLEWVNQRENMLHYHLKNSYSSKYVGVIYNKINNNWNSRINIKNKVIHIGTFHTEILAYQARLKYEKDNNIINKYNYE